MKVLHTISGLNKGSGGPTTCTYNLVKGLRRTGIDAKILTLAPANSNDSIIQTGFGRTPHTLQQRMLVTEGKNT